MLLEDAPSYDAGVAKPEVASPAKSKAQVLICAATLRNLLVQNSCPLGVRGFKSHPPHSVSILMHADSILMGTKTILLESGAPNTYLVS